MTVHVENLIDGRQGIINLVTGVTGILPVINGGTGLSVISGIYTPVFSLLTNLSTAAATAPWQYSITGGTVLVSGRFAADAVIITNTSFAATIPVPSSFVGTGQASGTFSSKISAAGAVNAFAFNLVDFGWLPTVITNETYFCIFQYTIV